MYCITLRTAVILSYLGLYALGAMFVGLVAYVILAYGGPMYKLPNKGDELIKCFVDALGGYTFAYNIWCQVATFKCCWKHPILPVIGLIVSCGMMIALILLMVYPTLNIWLLVSFCFIGAGFGELFVMTYSNLRKDAVLRQERDWMRMEEGLRQAFAFNSNIEEGKEKEDKM